jgi:hypothetical protein
VSFVERDVRGCRCGTLWGAHSSAGRAASGRASSASWRSKTSGAGGGERNFERTQYNSMKTTPKHVIIHYIKDRTLVGGKRDKEFMKL